MGDNVGRRRIFGVDVIVRHAAVPRVGYFVDGGDEGHVRGSRHDRLHARMLLRTGDGTIDEFRGHFTLQHPVAFRLRKGGGQCNRGQVGQQDEAFAN